MSINWAKIILPQPRPGQFEYSGPKKCVPSKLLFLGGLPSISKSEVLNWKQHSADEIKGNFPA